MRLPAPDASWTDITAYADALEDECIRDPNRAAWDISKQRWLDLYTGNHFADPLVSRGISSGQLEPEEVAADKKARAVCQIVYNRVMNAVLAMLAGQVSNPPKIVFGARESGEPPIYYLNGFIKHPALQNIAMAAGAADEKVQQIATLYGPDHPDVANAAMQAGQSIPLSHELAQQVKVMIDQGKLLTAQARLAGMPAPLDVVPPDALVEITDASTAQFTQTVFDGLAEHCGLVDAVAENVLNKKVMGWQPTVFESDRTKIPLGESPITLTNVEGTQVYFDPMTSSFRPPRYVLMKEPVSYEEALAKYPELADVLKGKADAGTLQNRDRSGAGGRLFELEYSRDMVVVRTLWIRDWPYPMEPDEAMTIGKVTMQSLPTGQVEPVMDEMGQPIGQRPVMRQAMVLAETGEETNPGMANWPIIHAIREIRDIQGEKAFDRRCFLNTIPVANNINIPVPFSPYGLGEPDRLDGLQMAINRILSDLVTNHRYNAYPPEVRRREISDAMGPVLKKMRTQPDRVVNVSADVAALVNNDLKQLSTFLEIPQMSPDAWRLLEFLVEAIDREAMNSDVQQGIAPAGTSGEWVANLQAAANQVAQVTSQSTEAWLKNLVRMFVHFIAFEMTEQDCQRYTAKYPPAIIAAFKSKQKRLYHDITVEVQSGSAAAKQGQTNAMIGAKGAGMTISEPSILERLNLDPNAELQREAEWLTKKRDSGLVDAAAEQQGVANNSAKAERGRSNATT